MILGVTTSILDTVCGAILKIIDGDEVVSEKTRRILKLIQTISMQVTPAMIQDIRNLPQVWEKIDAYRKKIIFDNLSQLLERGQETGEIRRDLDPRFMTKLFLDFFATLITPATIFDYNMAPHELCEKIASILMTGIITDRERSKLIERR